MRRISKLSYMKQGGPNKQEKALAKAFHKLAEKVQDPKHKGNDPIKVWTQIFSEVAEELEHGFGKDKG